MNKKYIWIVGAFILLYFSASYIAGFYADYQWFNAYNGTVIFWKLFLTKFYVHSSFSTLFIILFFLNFLLIRLLGGKGRIFTSNILEKLQLPVLGSPKKALFLLLAAGVITIGFLMGSIASAYWNEYLLFVNSVPFNAVDPIFGKDIGFYVFSLPFYEIIYNWVFGSFVVLVIFSVAFHILNGGIFASQGKLEFSLFARAHISTLLAILVAIYGIGYRISAYELLYSRIGKFFGAGYTAIHANLTAYTVAMVISFIAAGLFLFNIFKRSFKLPLFTLVTLIPIYFILSTIFPSILQKFFVEPNEIEMESPYIVHNIKFTRLAYDLNRVKTIDFANKLNLTYGDIQKNRTTIENVRLWDWRPLKAVYKQLQELKPYYYFHNVDVDRYIINNKKVAVNLSARELDIERLPKGSATWQNQHLIYTHGYGLVMSRVDQITPDGSPELIIKDIPPRQTNGIEIKNPAIYYGEHKNEYVIANTAISTGEFDYPFGEENKFTRYKGKGGVALDSMISRFLFAINFKDKNMLLSGDVTDKSRILYRRNIMEMVTTFTPFLEFDQDPYLIVSEGNLYWMIDAYTTCDQFPYSSPIRYRGKTINYIRNSVKVIIDAYNGSMTYYIVDENDPLIKTYARIFPGIFQKMSDMPEDLQAHVRYPLDIFEIQSHMLLKYHMTDPNVFYNNEDTWSIPKQVYRGSQEDVRSYYLVTKLPNEKRDEFILILPFTPYNRPNMTSLLAAKCDPPHYGELTLFKLPKEKNNYGPIQIEAKIDQDPEISSQLSLWDQKGSSVIRGNMLVIPIEESILYIEPLYLQAENSEMPELRRVIVFFGDKLVMEKDLPTAINRLFSGRGALLEQTTGISKESLEVRLKSLASKSSKRL